MSTQPEALRLADALEQMPGYDWDKNYCEAVAELRRLHQFAEDQIGRATAAEAALQMTKATHALKIAAVEAQRDALLKALKYVDKELSKHGRQHWPEAVNARAAIKAVEETK